ncbi:hypothetical protein PAMP_009053 [Pampus punctatissimus]
MTAGSRYLTAHSDSSSLREVETSDPKRTSPSHVCVPSHSRIGLTYQVPEHYQQVSGSTMVLDRNTKSPSGSQNNTTSCSMPGSKQEVISVYGRPLTDPLPSALLAGPMWGGLYHGIIIKSQENNR